MTRDTALTFLSLIFLIILLPAVAISVGRGKAEPVPFHFSPEDFALDQPLQAVQPVRIFFHRTGEIITLDLEEYLTGVVMAEMPLSFHPEALKAQAVAARTYAVQHSRWYGGGGCSQSPQPADLCTDSTCCQAWVDPEEAVRECPEEKRDQSLKRVCRAVQETTGEVITYRGTPIDAVYHSTCGGRTESAVALWGSEKVPYLTGVSCPYCSHSPRFTGAVTLPVSELAAVLPPEQALAVSGGSMLPAEILGLTPGGRVKQLRLGDLTLTGREARTLFGLPSTNFEFRWVSGGLLFECRGYGHGVGLCQYGADGAAVAGLSYRDILAFYYPGTNLTVLGGD